MNIEEQLLVENSSKNWNIIVDEVLKHPKRMFDLMELYFHEEYHRYNRATQVVGHLFNQRPDLVQPYSNRMINFLDQDPQLAQKRSIMRLHQWMDLNEETEGKLFDYSIKFLYSKDEPVATKAYATVVARRVCERYPELASEAIVPIQILVDENFSTGFVNRGRKELKKLRKIMEKSGLVD